MKKIGDFLTRFSLITPPNDSVKKELARILSRHIKKEYSRRTITVDRGVAFLRIPSVIKHTIMIKKGAILNELYEQIPKARDTVRDIR